MEQVGFTSSNAVFANLQNKKHIRGLGTKLHLPVKNSGNFIVAYDYTRTLKPNECQLVLRKTAENVEKNETGANSESGSNVGNKAPNNAQGSTNTFGQRYKLASDSFVYLKGPAIVCSSPCYHPTEIRRYDFVFHKEIAERFGGGVNLLIMSVHEECEV